MATARDRQYGSQGQQQTLVLALKLAELKLIELVIGEPPLLLLNDVLAELDPKRQRKLLYPVHDETCSFLKHAEIKPKTYTLKGIQRLKGVLNKLWFSS